MNFHILLKEKLVHGVFCIQSNLHKRPHSPHIDSCLNLSTTATFFCPRGGRFGEVQLANLL